MIVALKIHCNSYILYRFYVFVCALCNEGNEFLHRLDVKWVDVVHLSIFNLTLQDSKTYFEYEDTITQWINDNWELLQAPLGVCHHTFLPMHSSLLPVVSVYFWCIFLHVLILLSYVSCLTNLINV